ncbi:MAG: OFA family MFS transporter [Tenuifilaceae bacterium]|jgi:OFA family oxalate/formate antiporter-like MFS transporter|nr:OFA family MFS transporter [Bacteroidales bacterium]MDI9517283.1 OFA family MFS transporter [Bacteroidota bacterium]NLH55984.1 OFA family MFS transporter [Rikenellaceae bacterium]OQC62789.1 MAG: putative MFS-type transporter YhjX [Bacteroidetes bacterium ADurb.Bin008]HNV81883.1 OFA family MFS transporter [Tenuifilaceae bacterium]
MESKKHNRWLIAIMGTVLQLSLGTVYTWSFFQKPIMAAYGWNNVQVMWIFSIAICFLGLSAAVGGMILPKYGPKKLATTGALLYGIGYLISAYAMTISNLPLFYIGFGVIGGIGLGLGYVTPVATASKWFPDKKGFITGMVVMGFGLGALLMSKVIAPILMNITDGNIVKVFLYAGFVLLAIGVPAGLIMKNPPAGYVPEGYTPPVKSAASQGHEDSLTVSKCILSGKFWGMWIIFFMNIAAGIMFIGLQSPMLQDLLKIKNASMSPEALAAAGATLIGISSLFNGVGRFFWGGLSDKIGRIQAFRLILGSQVLVFIAMIYTGSPWLFGILVCYVLLCYGGGFGTMPSFVLDIFHAKLMPVVYGTILTAWSMAGIVGPQIAAYIKDHYAETAATKTFFAGAIMLAIGLLVSMTLSNKSITHGKE